jgi:hypothetical protein
VKDREAVPAGFGYRGSERSLLILPMGISCMEGVSTSFVIASISGHFHTIVAAI